MAQQQLRVEQQKEVVQNMEFEIMELNKQRLVVTQWGCENPGKRRGGTVSRVRGMQVSRGNFEHDNGNGSGSCGQGVSIGKCQQSRVRGAKACSEPDDNLNTTDGVVRWFKGVDHLFRGQFRGRQ